MGDVPRSPDLSGAGSLPEASGAEAVALEAERQDLKEEIRRLHEKKNRHLMWLALGATPAGLIAALMASAEGPSYLAAAVLAAGLGIEFFRYLRTRRSLKQAREVFASLPGPQLPPAP